MKVKDLKVRIVVAIIFTAILAVSLLFSAQIEKTFGLVETVSQKDFESTSEFNENIDTVKAGEAVIHFIDVGQGDATLIEVPSETVLTDDGGAIPGTFILIDGGSDDKKNHAAFGDNGKHKILNYLEERFSAIDNFVFDYVILSHAHEDHCGGLDNVLNEYPSKVVYRPNSRSTKYEPIEDNASKLEDNEKFWGTLTAKSNVSTSTYKNFLTAAYKTRFLTGAAQITKKVIVTNANDDSQNVIKGSRVYENGIPRDITSSNTEYFELKFHTPTNAVYSNVNDYSPVLTLDFNDKRVVITGDAESGAEQEFYNIYKDSDDFSKKADIVRTGHHGSKTSTSKYLLDIVAPKYTNANTLAVFSMGIQNSYGHPHSQTLSRLKEYGFKDENILRTDINGDIVISFKIDAEAADGSYLMMFGASMIRTVQEPPVPILWWHIALTIWVVGIIIIFTLKVSKSGKVSVGTVSAKGQSTSATKKNSKSAAKKTSSSKKKSAANDIISSAIKSVNKTRKK